MNVQEAQAPVSPDIGSEPTHARYLVLVWLCGAAAIAYICRNSIGVAEEAIRTDLGLESFRIFGSELTPKDQMGWVMSAFFITYSLFQLPGGWIGQVWGTRRALPVFSVVWSIVTGLMGLAQGFVGLFLTRFVSGAAQAGIFPCTTNTTARWFPLTARAFANGTLGAFMSVGGAAGTILTGVLLGYFAPGGWRWIFFLYTIPGLIWALAFYHWFRDQPEEHAGVNAAELNLIRDGNVPAADAESAAATPWSAILTSAAMWWICAQQFFRAAGYIFFASWFPTFLRETRGVSTAEAGWLTSLPLITFVLGSLTGGYCSDRIMKWTGSLRLARQALAIGSLLACAGLILLSFPIEHDLLAVLLISGGSFFSAVSGPCAYTITIDMGGKNVPMVFSLMNMSGNIGAVVFPVVVPRLVFWTGSWDLVLFVFAGLYVASALCWALLNPNGTIGARA